MKINKLVMAFVFAKKHFFRQTDSVSVKQANMYTTMYVKPVIFCVTHAALKGEIVTLTMLGESSSL